MMLSVYKKVEKETVRVLVTPNCQLYWWYSSGSSFVWIAGVEDIFSTFSSRWLIFSSSCVAQVGMPDGPASNWFCVGYAEVTM